MKANRRLAAGFAAFLLGAASLAVLPGTAWAGCFEGLGCTDVNPFSQANLRQQSCDTLFYARNAIYQEHGYCFKTARAKAVLGNAGCYIRDAGAVPLNRVERNNAAAIKEAERWLGCP